MTVIASAPPLARLKAILAEIADLRHVETIVDWDSRVFMPHAGAAARANLSATLTRHQHQRFVSDELGELLEELGSAEDDSVDAALVRVVRRDWDRARRVPTDLAAEMSHAVGTAVAAWDEAKAASDFASFVPHLERQLELKRRYIECFPPTDTPYDVLIEDYEEGMTTAQVAEVFARIKPDLVQLIEQAQPVDDAVLRGPFPMEGQVTASRLVLDAFGWDQDSWRLDETPHPFASKVGLGDIRLTTHSEHTDLNSLFSTMHEFGHGVYEFDIDPAFARTPLARGTSSSIHESQSRTWENLVGRSPGFWRWFYPQLQRVFPTQLGSVDEASFVSAANAIRPGAIRGDADEVSYGLHIILRFELEQELFAGAVAVRDLPEIWHTRMKEYLGVDVPDDAHGVLQDMHWSIGLFGYFPTYQLGNVISVQIWERAQADLGDLEADFERGEFSRLREWLREHVYRHGSRYPPRELVQRVTGSDLDPGPYLAYLRAKFA